MGETLVAESPDSAAPSLATVSQASTTDEDSPGLMSTPTNKSASQADFDSWQAILEDDEDEYQSSYDRASQCSSGILSSETLDFTMDARQVDTASIHSLASMKTVKSHPGRSMEEPSQQEDHNPTSNPVDFEVDAEEIPVNRACHGALSISPKQLADVFALFSKDAKPKESTEAKTTMVSPGIIQLAPTTSRAVPVPPHPPHDYPMSMEERYRYKIRSGKQHKLTAELYWKPRAKSLEKECETLKEILSDDSNKILQLKGALETLRMERLRSLVESKSFHSQLQSARNEIDTLKKEREMLLENQTEYRETIRILKHEVDMLTRQDEPPELVEELQTPPRLNRRNTAERDELEQLRLENQLFATQIVDYEAELERLEQQIKSTAGQEQQDTREALRAMKLARSISWLEKKNNEQSPETEGLGADPSDLEDRYMSLEEDSIITQTVETTLSCEESMAVVVTAASAGEEEDGIETDKQKGIEDIDDAASREEPKTPGEGEDSDGERCLDQIGTMGMTSELPQQIIGNVLGMFTVGGSTEGGKENAGQDDVFVLHEAAPTSNPSDAIHYLQWKTPNQLPTFVKVDKVVPIEKVEARNPPSSPSSGPLTDKTNQPSQSMRSLWEKHEESRCGGGDDTSIEVLQTGDGGASQSIEVQLASQPAKPPSSGEAETTCKDECDLWSALSHCPFASESDQSD